MRTPAIKINLLPETRAERMLRVRSHGKSSIATGELRDVWQWASKWDWLGFAAVGSIFLDTRDYNFALVLFVCAVIAALSKISSWTTHLFSKVIASTVVLVFLAVVVHDIRGDMGVKPSAHTQPPEHELRELPDGGNRPASPDRLPIPASPTVEALPKPKPDANTEPRKAPKQRTNEPSSNEDADLDAVFTNPSNLSVTAKNISKVNAWDTKFVVELWNLEEERNKVAETALSLPIFSETARGDFIKPGWGTTPRTVLDSARSSGRRLSPGDRLAGYAAVTCSNCKTARWYWVFYVEGKGGWYSAIPVGQSPDQKVWGKVMEGLANDPGAEDFVTRDVVKVKIQDWQ